MSSKSKKKRARYHTGITLPGGDIAMHRPHGRDRRHTNQTDECPTKTVIDARARHTGIVDRDSLKGPLLSTAVGCCIYDLSDGDERRRLIDTWSAISGCRRNYMVRYIGMTGEPKGAAIAMVPGRIETDPSLRIDTRTQAERAAQSINAWRAWDAKINALPSPQMKWGLRQALNGFTGEASLWRNKSPTDLGKAVIAALRHIAATS